MANNNPQGGRRPPKEYQFQKGQSGNPRGRPKGSKNLKTLTDELLSSYLPTTSNGKRITYREGFLIAVAHAALKGSLEHLKWLIEHDPAQGPLY